MEQAGLIYASIIYETNKKINYENVIDYFISRWNGPAKFGPIGQAMLRNMQFVLFLCG